MIVEFIVMFENLLLFLFFCEKPHDYENVMELT